MKSIATIAVAITLLVPCLCTAQEQANSGTGRIGVLDVAKVFEEHKQFTSAMEKLKAEVQSFDAQMKMKGEALRNEAAGLKQFKPSSPQYTELEGNLAKKDAELKILANQKRKEILDKEAKLYLETYAAVQNMVKRIADANGITLVLRFDSSKIDSTDRASVIKGVNRDIVYQNKLDLTDFVLQQFNPQSASAPRSTPK